MLKRLRKPKVMMNCGSQCPENEDGGEDRSPEPKLLRRSPKEGGRENQKDKDLQASYKE